MVQLVELKVVVEEEVELLASLRNSLIKQLYAIVSLI